MTFMFSQRCHVRSLVWVIMAFGLLSPGARNTAMAAPPDFAGAGMAPNNVDVVVRISGAEGSGDWARYFEDVASDSLGTQAVDQWRTLTSFLRSIVGEGVDGGRPASHLYIRFGTPGMNPDWVYAIELFDRQKCEQGFRDSEAVLKLSLIHI